MGMPSVSSSLRSVMYILTVECLVFSVDNLILVFSSVKTNNSIVQTLVQNSFFFRDHLEAARQSNIIYYIQQAAVAVRN